MVTRRVALVAMVALAAMAVGAVVYARRVDPGAIGGAADPARLPVLADAVPALDAANGWLNSPALGRGDLAGRVVVYDFWTYSCVNCVRTLPYLRAWHERYARDGLVIVGVHSPEFEFERDHDNVALAVDELGVTWPVAFDDDMVIWAQFENRYWPAKYLTDRQGRLRYFHFGEGAYDRTEDVIRALLGVPEGAPRAEVRGAGDESEATAAQTPELYLGERRGRLADPQALEVGEQQFERPSEIPVDQVALDGWWEVAPEFVEARRQGATIVVRYRGGEVNLVMEPAGGAGTVEVRVRLDGEPAATVIVDGPRLYRLLAGGPPGAHLLEVEAAAAGLRAYAFTFGS